MVGSLVGMKVLNMVYLLVVMMDLSMVECLVHTMVAMMVDY